MKLTCTQRDLLEAIQIAQKAVSVKSTLPVLSGILMQSNSQQMILQGTDLEMAVEHRRKVRVSDTGSVVVPAKLINDIVRSLSEEALALSFNQEQNKLNIIGRKVNFLVNTMPAEDFPRFPEIDDDERAQIEIEPFIKGVAQVLRAVSRDESRPVLAGVLLTTKKNKAKMVATDSYRLAVRELPGRTKDKKEVSLIIPGKTLEETLKIISLSGRAKEVKIGVSENQVLFDLGETRILSRVIAGKYPQYQKIFPEAFQTKIEVLRDDIIAATRRASLFSANNAPFKIKVVGKEISIFAESPESGEAHEVVEGRVSGEDIEVAFNPRFFLDGLTSISGQEVVLEIADSQKPSLIRPKEEENFLYLIMPMRVS